MASAYPTLPRDQEIQELDPQHVQSGVYDIIQKLSLLSCSSGEASFSNLEFAEEINIFLETLNQMVSQLQQVSGIITEFRNSVFYLEKFGVSKLDDLKSILDEVEECKRILELYVPRLSLIRGNSQKIYMILIQLVLEGVQIPRMEEFNQPIQVSIINIMQAIQDANTQSHYPIGPVVGNIVKVIVQGLGNQFAECKKYQHLLNYAACIFGRVSDSMCRLVYQHSESCIEAYNKVIEFKKEFTTCGIKIHLQRINTYLDQAIENTNYGVIEAVNQCISQVWESVKSTKLDHPYKSNIEILKEIRKYSPCVGLVQPIVTNMNCSSHEAWEIVIQIFSLLPNPTLL